MPNYRFETEKPEKLSHIIERNNIHFSMPCSGAGKCGKCKIHVKGDISPICRRELEVLSEDEIKKGIRLACFTTVYSKAEVETDGFSLEGLSEFSGRLQFSDKKRSGLGIAVDIGTTTIAGAVVDFETETVMETFSFANPQARYGADVVGRIHAAATGKAKFLTDTIQNSIKDIFKKYSFLSRAVITANTAMLHILTGKSTEGFLAYPFTPESRFGYWENTDEIQIYYPPCPSAFIGADILCGTLLQDDTCTSLLADIGTNGELALNDHGNIFFSSVAAGPAFEGTEIRCGMPAAAGAVASVYLEDGYKLRCRTIQDAKPIGICGSALIDTLYLYLKLGILDKTGCIRTYGHRYPQLIITKDNQQAVLVANSGLYLTQEDIRKLQLAKAAFGAGIKTLVRMKGLEKADKLYIAGGFGSYLNISHAIGIGLIPDNMFSEVIPLGNSALFGAAQVLVNEESEKKIELAAEKAQTIELSLTDFFQETYMKQIDF